MLDHLIMGVTCKPFSLARTGRVSKGSQTHKDADLMTRALDAIVKLEPLHAYVENVQGWLRFCKNLGKTPLAEFLDRAESMGLKRIYTIKVILIDARMFLNLWINSTKLILRVVLVSTIKRMSRRAPKLKRKQGKTTLFTIRM